MTFIKVNQQLILYILQQNNDIISLDRMSILMP